jgi:CheY-like chemotaxis protein
MSRKSSILLIDDDPVHLDIYRQIVESAGFMGIPVLVSFRGICLPQDGPVDAVLLDYRLAPNISALEVVEQVRGRFPAVPIAVLSDMFAVPDELAPLVQAYVRKGNPEKLLETLRKLVVKTASGNL